jgi:ribosomal protein S18 acetylase RimI-like enzyme
MYIMTLGVLAPYRGHGIGRRLLELVLEKAQKIPDISTVFLHVQVNNDDAIQFYKKFGFEITGTLEGYYKKITPADCYIVEKKITH